MTLNLTPTTANLARPEVSLFVGSHGSSPASVPAPGSAVATTTARTVHDPSASTSPGARSIARRPNDGATRRHLHVLSARRWWYGGGARLVQWGLGLVIGVVLVIRIASGALTPHGPGASGEHAPEAITVEVNDTWWSVATRLFPDRDPRAAVDLVMAERAGRSFVPGERVHRSDLNGSLSLATSTAESDEVGR